MSTWPRQLRRMKPGGLIEYKTFANPGEVEPGFEDDAATTANSARSEFPAFRYPPGAAPSAGKIFTKAEDVPEGWLDHPTIPEPAPKPTIKPGPVTPLQGQALKESVALLTSQLEAATKALDAERARNAELEAQLAARPKKKAAEA